MGWGWGGGWSDCFYYESTFKITYKNIFFGGVGGTGAGARGSDFFIINPNLKLFFFGGGRGKGG